MSPGAGAFPLRLATRGSALARAQAALAAAALRAHAGVDTTIVVIRTSGDRAADVPLDRLEGQGWFTAELERALLDAKADVAVHSAKDLPTAATPGLTVAANLERGDPRDGVVTPDGRPLDALEDGATVGTSSARRIALLRWLYPTLMPRPIRGNVDTRLRKLDSGEVDALLLACAGLDRLGSGDRLAERLDPAVFVPAPAQGAIALQARTGSPAAELCAAAGDHATEIAVRAERATLAALGGGCLLPLGAWARRADDQLVLTAALARDGGAMAHGEVRGPVEDPEALGASAARILR